MLRTHAFTRLAGLAAAAAFSAIFLTGCVEDSPRTQLDWYPQGDVKKVHHYAYNDDQPSPPPHVVHKKKPAPVQAPPPVVAAPVAPVAPVAPAAPAPVDTDSLSIQGNFGALVLTGHAKDVIAAYKILQAAP